MRNSKTELNKTQDNDVWAACQKCTIRTAHKVCVSVDISETIEEQGFQYHAWENYQVIQCQGCKTISFRKNSGNTEDEDWDEVSMSVVFLEHVELYPNRMDGRRELPNTRFLPLGVGRLYQELLTALSNKSSVLAGIGVRALVEAICKERSATGKTLENRIDDLVRQGVLTIDGAEILHSLRLMGNEAAHEAKPYNEKELYTAIEVAEHLLNTVYLIPKRASSLPRRPKVS